MVKTWALSRTFLLYTLRKKAGIVGLVLLSLLLLRAYTYKPAVEFSRDNRLLDLLSFTHFFGTWITVVVVGEMFYEVFSRRGADFLLTLGVPRRALVAGCVGAVLATVIIWSICSALVMAIALRVYGALIGRVILAALLIGFMLTLIVSFSLVLVHFATPIVASFVSLALYILISTFQPVSGPWRILLSVFPSLSRLYIDATFLLVRGTVNPGSAPSMLVLMLWLLLSSLISCMLFELKDLPG